MLSGTWCNTLYLENNRGNLVVIGTWKKMFIKTHFNTSPNQSESGIQLLRLQYLKNPSKVTTMGNFKNPSKVTNMGNFFNIQRKMHFTKNLNSYIYIFKVHFK